jgi:P4 family phage/plasmid primase-like protien
MRLKNRLKIGSNGQSGQNGQSFNGNGSNGHKVWKEKKVRPNAKAATLETYAKEVMDDIGPIRCQGDIWYRYENGVWLEIDQQQFYRAAWEIQNEPRKVEASKKIIEAIRQQTQLVDGEQMYGAIRYIEGETHYLINCKNCVLQVSLENGSIKTVNHDEKWMFAGQIASSYHADLGCPNFIQVLRKVLPAKANRVLLLDFATSCLLPDSRFQCMLFCTGSGGNGKSTIWEAIARCFGKDLVARINYHDICANNKKYIWRLNRMLLNLGTETQGKAVGENAVLKAIVCGEEFDSDRMYRDSFRMKTTAKLAFLTNHPLRYEQASDADYRRTRIIHFGETFIGNEKASIELESMLRYEMDGLFSFIIRRISRVSFLRVLNFGDEVSQAAYNMFKTGNNPILEFYKKCLKNGEGCQVEKGVIWDCYRNYAHIFNYQPYSKVHFFRKLYQINPSYAPEDSIKRPRRSIDGKRMDVIVGCQLTDYGQELVRNSVTLL